MAGLEDLMNIRTEGGTANAPPMDPMAPPPMAPPPMGGPPMDGMPPPGMGEMAAAGGGPPMGGAPVDIEGDSAILAEAVVGRAQGDIGAAIAVLDTAKAMLMQSAGGGEPPMGGPQMAAFGGPMGRRGNPPPSRRMINTPKRPIQQALSTQGGQPMSPDLNAQMQGSSMGQSLSDATPPPGFAFGGPMGGRQNLANEETNRPNFGRDTTNYQYRNAAPPGFAFGGPMGGRQNLANEETNRPNFGKDNVNYQRRNHFQDFGGLKNRYNAQGGAGAMPPPGFASGGPMYANMGGQATMGGRQNLANEETNRPNFGRDTTNYQYRNATPPGFASGGDISQNDVMREMIMQNLQKPEVQQEAMSNVMGTSQEDALARLMKFNSA
tara:strand:- start:1809 stop:2948 length:1140 start_codon:yes stop_codon:yes gene_type:complete